MTTLRPLLALVLLGLAPATAQLADPYVTREITVRDLASTL